MTKGECVETIGSLMDLPSILTWLREEWSQVKQARGTFVTFVVLAFAGGAWATRLYFFDHIATLRQQIDLRDDQLRSCREARPDVARLMS